MLINASSAKKKEKEKKQKRKKEKKNPTGSYTQLAVTQIPREKSNWGEKILECQTTFIIMYQEPSMSPTPLILGHTTHMQSAENPDLKVLVRQGLVIE